MYTINKITNNKTVVLVKTFDTLKEAKTYLTKSKTCFYQFIKQVIDRDDIEAAIETVKEAIERNCPSCVKAIGWATTVLKAAGRKVQVQDVFGKKFIKVTRVIYSRSYFSQICGGFTSL